MGLLASVHLHNQTLQSALCNFYRTTKKMVTIVTQHLSDRVSFPSLSKTIVNDKVTIRWLTEEGWKGIEQSFKRRCLLPAFSVLVGNSSRPYMDVKCKTTNYITNLTRVCMTIKKQSRDSSANIHDKYVVQIYFQRRYLFKCVKISTDSKGKNNLVGKPGMIPVSL